MVSIDDISLEFDLDSNPVDQRYCLRGLWVAFHPRLRLQGAARS